MKHKILIVDDEEANLRALVRLFSLDYEPHAANSGLEAVGLMQQHDFAMIISDQRMPEMSGLEFLIKAATIRPQTIRILLTGYTEVDTLVEAINSGVVYKFLSKPWMNDDLVLVVKRALEHFTVMKKSHGYNHDIHRLNQKLDAASEALVLLWSENIKLRSPELFAHAQRMSRTAKAMSDLLPMESRTAELTATAALLFPIVYSPDRIPDILMGQPVSDRELVSLSSELEESLGLVSRLRSLDDFNEIETIVRFANEHYDGNGFPNRLAGESIPLASRILTAIRGYDLLTRVELDEFELSHENAIDYMLNSKASGVYDPSVVEILDRVEPCSLDPEIVFAPDPLPPTGDGFQNWIGAD
jgi:response regulator RpfG family c-di-GMP phosphodiesterase